MTFSDKDKYRSLCEDESIPLFMQAWWMDAVCVRGYWDVFLYEKNGKIIAAMPFHVRKKLGFKFIIEPQLTQYSGIWIKHPENITFQKKYTLEKEVYFYFIEQLNQYGFTYYQQTFPPSFTNWQPFYWKGFKQTTRYTFIIDSLTDTSTVYEKFSQRKKRDIKKAESRLTVSYDLTADEFYQFHRHSLLQKGERINYSRELIARISTATNARNQGMIMGAYDNEQHLQASLLVIWDKQCAYCLAYALDNQYKNSGASTLLFWRAIQQLSTETTIFDFEGSMIESVADSYLQFSSASLPFYSISKSNALVACLIKYSGH